MESVFAEFGYRFVCVYKYQVMTSLEWNPFLFVIEESSLQKICLKTHKNQFYMSRDTFHFLHFSKLFGRESDLKLFFFIVNGLLKKVY